jgi:hypothetical protein
MAKAPRTPGVAAPAPSEPLQQEPDTTVTEDMPNAIDIDPFAITGPVLTKQGWVCPADKPKA